MITDLETTLKCTVCGWTGLSVSLPFGLQTPLPTDQHDRYRVLRVGDEIQLPERVSGVRGLDYFEVGCVATALPREQLVSLEVWTCPRGCDAEVQRNAVRVRVEHGRIEELAPVAFEADEVRRAGFVSWDFNHQTALFPMLARFLGNVDVEDLSDLTVEDLFTTVCTGTHPLLHPQDDVEEDGEA